MEGSESLHTTEGGACGDLFSDGTVRTKHPCPRVFAPRSREGGLSEALLLTRSFFFKNKNREEAEMGEIKEGFS